MYIYNAIKTDCLASVDPEYFLLVFLRKCDVAGSSNLGPQLNSCNRFL